MTAEARTGRPKSRWGGPDMAGLDVSSRNQELQTGAFLLFSGFVNTSAPCPCTAASPIRHSVDDGGSPNRPPQVEVGRAGFSANAVSNWHWKILVCHRGRIMLSNRCLSGTSPMAWAMIRGHVAHRHTLPFESKAR